MTSPVNAFIFQNSDMSRTQAEQVWSVLQQGIEEIQNGNASSLRFEELYRNAYTLVLHKHGDLLYEGVERTICSKLTKTADSVKNTTDNLLIEVVVKRWENHRLVMTMIRDILMYMDKTHCEIKKKTPVHDLGLLRFKEHVIMHPHVLGRLRGEILRNIRAERNGEQIDQALMRNALHMFVEVDKTNQQSELYDAEFEHHFLGETRIFYQHEAELFITSNSVPEYLKKAETRLNQEQQRADSYIPKATTRFELRKACEFELIGRFATQLVQNTDSGCAAMFVKSKVDDIHRMYNLFKRLDNTTPLLEDALYAYIITAGKQIVNDVTNLKNPQKFVEEVLQLREQFQKIVDVSFRGDNTFTRKLKEAFEHFINTNVRTAQYLSLYTDSLLRTAASKMTEHDVDQRLNDVIQIFKYLSDKDIFEDFYKQQLASRLLQSRASSDHHERSMIAMLKQECGHNFTTKLEGMFKDIDQSRTLREKWHSHLRQSSQHPIVELDTQVLTTGCWPFQSEQKCNLPPQLVEECEKYKIFYAATHSGRRLSFDTLHGTADMEVDFEGGTKHLNVQTYQMCILMLFKEHTQLSWGNIKNMLGVNAEVLQRHIMSLAHPKIRILRKKPNTNDLEDDHMFRFNYKYKNQRVRVVIGLLSAPKTVKDTKPDVPQNVLEARKNGVEAAIVRIMKSRKKYGHQQLVADVIKQTSSRFKVTPAFIKQRIAGLIEREFLSRDLHDRKVYHYLA